MEMHFIETTTQAYFLTVLITAYNRVGWGNITIHKDLQRSTTEFWGRQSTLGRTQAYGTALRFAELLKIDVSC